MHQAGRLFRDQRADVLNAGSLPRRLGNLTQATNLSGDPRMLTVGDLFPQFSCQACVGTGKDYVKLLSNADYAGKWVVYFFYPKDFTFVCPT